MKIVALSGKMHSGKSYVAERLVEEYGFHRVSFAQALKDDIRDMYFYPKDIKEKPPWMRQLMQAYGQARRATNPDHWIHRVEERLDYFVAQRDLFRTEPLIVIDDMRFGNEMDALEDYGYSNEEVEVYFVRLERDGYDRSGIPGADEASETDLDDVPLVDWTQTWVIGSGDLEGLKFAADDIANVMGVSRVG